MIRTKDIIILQNLIVTETDVVVPIERAADFVTDKDDYAKPVTSAETIYEYTADGALGHMSFRSKRSCSPNQLLALIIDRAANHIRLIREAEMQAASNVYAQRQEIQKLKARICDLNDQIDKLQ